jgi:hypothetical protein
MPSSQSANKSEEIEQVTDFGRGRGRIVALVVKDACIIASLGPNHKDWNAARRFIIQNKLLTDNEKSDIVKLLCDDNDNM